MGRIQAPKTLRTEDFAPDQQELVSKLAFVLNNFRDEVFNLLNGNIDFNNLAQSIRTINVTTDSFGKVTSLPIRLTYDTPRRASGVICVGARNVTSPTSYLTSAPFISFNTESGVITILNVAGLPIDSTISLTILIICE